MTANLPTITEPQPSALAAKILLVALSAGLTLLLLASVSTLAPTFESVRALHEKQMAGVAPSGSPTSDQVRPAGGTVEVDGWSIRVGELQWNQTAAVANVSPLNPLVAERFEWVLLPIEVTSKGGAGTALNGMEVVLMTDEIMMSHRYKSSHHYPMSKLPNELDVQGIPDGASRSGNVGWSIPSAVREAGTCLIRVHVGDTSAVFACGAPAS